MILLKLQYREIWSILLVGVYHFYLPIIHLFKKQKQKKQNAAILI